MYETCQPRAFRFIAYDTRTALIHTVLYVALPRERGLGKVEWYT